MTVLNVLLMTLSELFGNTHLKWFSENKDRWHLTMGLLAYMSVIFFLIRSFSSKSMMWTCVMWEAMIVIGGAIVAYFVFGEKFTHWIQGVGILLALGAAVCVNYECDVKTGGGHTF
jgi:multidrug transporter EmrE-like cation transporter